MYPAPVDVSRALAPTLLSIPEAVSASRACRSIIYRELAAGRIRAVKIGRRTFIRADSLEAWMQALPAFEPRAA
jgi:excisionase family DNA binding protein